MCNKSKKKLIVNKNQIVASVISIICDNYYEEIIVLGKGPTFAKYKEYNSVKKNFIIGINDTINIVKSDMLVANDIETFDRLDSKMVSGLKFILVPCHPHQQEYAHKNITFFNILEKKSLNLFSGKIIPFNLKTYNKNYTEYISLDSAISSANTAIDFIDQYLYFINKIILFGIGILDNPKYDISFPSTGGVNTYCNNKILMIKNHICKTLTHKNWELN